MQTPAEIDRDVDILIKLLTFVSKFYAPLAVALPTVTNLIRLAAVALKSGIAQGTLVFDGKGGIVPATNSHYDQKTGKFI